MKRILLCLIVILLTVCTKAQVRQYSANIAVNTPIDVPTKINYPYILNSDGEKIIVGQLTISGSRQFTFNGVYLTAQYLLKAGHNNKGFLNGPISFSSKYTAQRLNKSAVEIYSMSGNFLNGLPHGQFNVQYYEKGKGSFSFKNGILCGKYSISSLEAGDIEGTLDQNSRPIGDWNINGKILYFVNGVATNGTEAESKLAKLIPSGEITLNTKKEFLVKGYLIETNSLYTKSFMYDLLFGQYLVPWKELGYYDFSENRNIEYVSLKKAGILDNDSIDKKIEWFKQLIAGKIKIDDFEFHDIRNKKYFCFNYDDSLDSYYSGGYYLIDNGIIDTLSNIFNKNRVLNFEEVLSIASKRYSDAYENLKHPESIKSSMDNDYIYKTLNDTLFRQVVVDTDYYQKELYPMAPNNNNVIIARVYDDGEQSHGYSEKFRMFFITKESYNSFKKTLKGFNIAYFKNAEEIKRKQLIENFPPILEPLVSFLRHKKLSLRVEISSDIEEHPNNWNDYCFKNNSLRYCSGSIKDSLENHLKPFYPIESYEILDAKEISNGYGGYNVTCKFVRRKKKNEKQTIIVTLFFDSGYHLHLESFDINKAKVE